MTERFEFQVTEHISSISENKAGYTLELNKVSYNGNPAKLDLRRWKDGKPLKGITLSDDEARSLFGTLKTILEK